MNTFSIVLVVFWYLIGAVGFIFTRRYYADITIFDLVISLLFGIGGIFSLLFCLCRYTGEVVVFKKRRKKPTKIVENVIKYPEKNTLVEKKKPVEIKVSSEEKFQQDITTPIKDSEDFQKNYREKGLTKKSS